MLKSEWRNIPIFELAKSICFIVNFIFYNIDYIFVFFQPRLPQVHIWDVESLETLHVIKSFDRAVTALGFSTAVSFVE